MEQYNRGGMWAFLFSMAFSIGFILYLSFFQGGIKTSEKVIDPKALAASGDETKAEFKIESVQEPWVSNEDMVAYGQKLFTMNCSTCHGPEGKGDGEAGAALNPKPRNLVEGKWTQGEGMVAHFKVLSNGIAGTSMASYAHMKPPDRWALVQYIESITQNKSKDAPEKVAEFAKGNL